MSEEERVSGILNSAVSHNLLNDATPSIDAFDLDYFSGRLFALKSAFPEDFILNAVALKANSIRGILRVAAEKGFGAECASISEVVHALSLKFPPSHVVYDSPVKTRLLFKYNF
jgi:diaminopimelate decarboxylase